MVTNFFHDLAQAQTAEVLVAETLSGLTKDYQFINVGNQRAYFHKGDIKAVGADGREIMIEVKKDSRIGQTHNLLCEEEVYYFDTNSFAKGNFYSDYEIYCVVSESERKMYFMDFSILKKHYKSGTWKQIRHYDQTTYCYLCSLSKVRSWGAMIAEITY